MIIDTKGKKERKKTERQKERKTKGKTDRKRRKKPKGKSAFSGQRTRERVV